MFFTLKHPCMTEEDLGLLPDIFSLHDPRSAAAQANDRYAHGGGWSPFSGFTVTPSALHYPGDPPQKLLAEAHLPLTNEIIRLYEHAWVGVFQADGSVEIARMD